MSDAEDASPEELMLQEQVIEAEEEEAAAPDAAEDHVPPGLLNFPNVFDAFHEGFNGFPDEDDEDEDGQPDVVIWQDNDANNFGAWDNPNGLAEELAMGVPAPVYVVQGFGAVDEDQDDQDLVDAVGGAVGNAVQNELQALFEADDPNMHNFYQPLLDMSNGMAASLSKFRQARNRPVKPLLRLSMLQFLRTVDVRSADRILQHEMPRTLFYDLLHVALYSKDSRSMMIQMILKYWPERTLKVTELKRCLHHMEAPIPFAPCTAEKTLLSAFFSGFGNAERKHLRCLDLRGANERFLDRLEEYQGFYTDPFFKASEYCIILPIRYVYRRAYALDYILHDWLKVLRKSPTFFKVSSLTMDFTKNDEMEIMNFMTIEHMDAFHLGRYRLYRDESPPQHLEHHFPGHHQQPQHEINHFSAAASDWRNRVCLFTNLTSLTISSMSTISPLRKIVDKSSCAPDAPLVESWNGILRELTKLKRLSVVFQTLSGQLKRLLDGATFKLLSLSLEGSVLSDADMDYMREFMAKQSQTVNKVHLGIWNFKEHLEKIMTVLTELKQVNHLTLHMSGRLDQRDQRRIPRDHMRRLSTCLRGSVKELRILHLCEFNVDTPGLVVELIDSLLPKSNLMTLIIPTKVLRTMEDGTSVPFLGDLKRMGTGSKYEPFVEAYKRHLCASDLKHFTAKATYDGIKLSTSRQQNRMAFALR